MIKYRVLSKKEKALPPPPQQQAYQESTTYRGRSAQSWPNTQEYLDQVLVAAAANGFIVGAEVVRKSVLHVPCVIEEIETDLSRVYGSAKPYFIKLSNNQMLFHPDELILIEEDKCLDFNLEMGASCG